MKSRVKMKAAASRGATWEQALYGRHSWSAPAISALSASSPKRWTRFSSEGRRMGSFFFFLTTVLAVAALGGVVFAFSGPSAASKKRVAAVARPSAAMPSATKAAALAGQQRRKSVQTLLKDIEKQQSERKQ